ISNIENAKNITNSDYSIVWLLIDSSDLLEKNKIRNKKKQNETRRIYLYHKATKEDWDAYSQKVEQIFTHAEKKPKKQDIRIDNIEKENIDESWDTIIKAITTTANEFILSTKT